MTGQVLELDDLCVDIHADAGIVHAVDSASLTVSAGEIVGIVGESGSGKSTMLKAVAGVLPRRAVITSGTVRVGEGENRRGKQPMSMVFQEPLTALDPVMRVGDQVAEAPQRLLGLSRRDAQSSAIELMKEVGIPDPARRYRAYPHQLSGGMRQRVLIAAALSGEPELLLCDEPTTALDVTVQAQIIRLLRRTCERRNVGILYVTHDLSVVSQLCDRMLVMYAGRLVESGPVKRVFTDPLHPYTEALLEALPGAQPDGARLKSIGGSPPSLIKPPAGCRFHPRCIHARVDCASGAVPLRPMGEGRASACRHAETIFGRPEGEER